jgi:hypothetical protein
MKTNLNKTGKFRALLTLFAAIAVVFSIQSCDLHEISYPEDEVGYVSYSASIQPIFNTDCLDCHSGAISPNLSEGSSWAALTTNGYIDKDNAESSLLYTTLQSSDHRPNWNPNPTKLNLILDWIKAGAPND